MTSVEQVQYLVASPNAAFRELVRFVLEWQFECEVVVCESGPSALEYLRRAEKVPHMVMYEYEADSFLLEDFIVYSQQGHQQIEFVILGDKNRDFNAKGLDQYPSFHLIAKEQIWQKVFQLSRLMFKSFIQDNQAAMCRIHMEGLTVLSGIDKDLFIKLNSGKLVRLFESGNVKMADLHKYRDKGLHFLWLERPKCDWIVQQVKEQFHIFVANKNFKFILREQTSETQSNDDKIIRICDELHLDAKFKQEIDQTMIKVLDVVQKDLKLASIIKMIRENNPAVSYFAKNLQLTSLISCFLAKQMEWGSKSTLEKLVYASVLRDITLATKPHLQCLSGIAEFNLVAKNLSEEDQKIYLNHTREGSQLVKTHFKLAPPETDVLVLHHHELPGGKGFPGKLSTDRLSPLAQLFIVTQDFVCYVMNESEPNLDVYFLQAERRFEQSVFRRFITVLKKFKTNS